MFGEYSYERDIQVKQLEAWEEGFQEGFQLGFQEGLQEILQGGVQEVLQEDFQEAFEESFRKARDIVPNIIKELKQTPRLPSGQIAEKLGCRTATVEKLRKIIG